MNIMGLQDPIGAQVAAASSKRCLWALLTPMIHLKCVLSEILCRCVGDLGAPQSRLDQPAQVDNSTAAAPQQSSLSCCPVHCCYKWDAVNIPFMLMLHILLLPLQGPPLKHMLRKEQ
jgi:hypothetical protein